jgi:hypothetical protein
VGAKRHNQVTDLRGVGRLAIDATAGLTSLVEDLHTHISGTASAVGGPAIAGAVNGITGLVYAGVRGATRAVGAGIDVALAQLAPMLRDMDSTPARETFVAALNGLLGDYLAETGNPLALAMRFRRRGAALDLTRDGLARALPSASPTVVVLVHGLFMNDLLWKRKGHDHGAALARDLACTPLYLHYNSGLHVSTNGRELAALLEAVVAAWPVPLRELVVVGHSMGGLVARSAHHYGTAAAHSWVAKVAALVFLGAPHHGAPLERGGNRIGALLQASPYSAPFARLGHIRSAGITDLRYGALLDEDWQGRDRFARGKDPRRPVPLPEGPRCYTIAAALPRSAHPVGDYVPGDGLVPVESALGRHHDPRLALVFPRGHQWVARGSGHLDLLSRPSVYERLRGWLARPAGQ